MRKYLLLIALVIVAIIFFVIMFFGIKIGNFTIVNSYKDIETLSNEKNTLLAELNYKNNNDFSAKKLALESAVDEYNTKKSKYDASVAAGEITDSDIYNSMDLYDVDFLWTTIGNYATEAGVTLQFDVTRSSTATAITSDYVMCDLSFTVTGEYISITDFIYSLENDDTLGFEINDFSMEKGGENLQAIFKVKEVPVNNKNISSVPTIVSSDSTTTYDENSDKNN
jgi:hypothetical protein